MYFIGSRVNLGSQPGQQNMNLAPFHSTALALAGRASPGTTGHTNFGPSWGANMAAAIKLTSISNLDSL